MIAAKRALSCLLLVALPIVGGCGLFEFIDRDEGYDRSEPRPPLEVPPDLSAPVKDPGMSVPDTIGGTPGPVGEAPLPPDLDGIELPEAPEIELPRDASGAPYLVLGDTVRSAWRRTGYALERSGFSIAHRDDLRMIYVVRYAPASEKDEGRGFFGWLFGRSGDTSENRQQQYQVSLVGAGENTTHVMVLDRAGEPESSESAERILAIIAERLKPVSAAPG